MSKQSEEWAVAQSHFMDGYNTAIKEINVVIPTKEMLEAYLKDKHQDADTEAKMWYWAGIAAYAHLSSPASDEWKREHGFLKSEEL